MPIAARVVSLALKATGNAVFAMTAEVGCAARDEVIDDALLNG
jgi:hypothetical protein